MIACFISCTDLKPVNKNFITKKLYSSGKIQAILSLNSDSLKNGESFYLDENGYLDSSVEYINGKRNGFLNKYYDIGIYSYEFRNDTLIKERYYDSLNQLLVETPIDIKKVGRTKIKFTGNHNYFDPTKVDTLEIFNEGLPPGNRSLSVIGAIIEHINDNTFTIRTSKEFKDLKEVILKISIRQNLGDTTEVPVPFETISIPLK